MWRKASLAKLKEAAIERQRKGSAGRGRSGASDVHASTTPAESLGRDGGPLCLSSSADPFASQTPPARVPTPLPEALLTGLPLLKALRLDERGDLFANMSPGRQAGSGDGGAGLQVVNNETNRIQLSHLPCRIGHVVPIGVRGGLQVVNNETNRIQSSYLACRIGDVVPIRVRAGLQVVHGGLSFTSAGLSVTSAGVSGDGSTPQAGSQASRGTDRLVSLAVEGIGSSFARLPTLSCDVSGEASLRSPRTWAVAQLDWAVAQLAILHRLFACWLWVVAQILSICLSVCVCVWGGGVASPPGLAQNHEALHAC
jgi:hypothetical protein